MESFLRLCTSSMLPSLCAEDLNKANTKTRFSKLQWERGKKHGDARQWRSRKIAFRVFVSFSLLRCFSGLDDETGKKFISIKMVNKDLWVIEWSGACFLRACKIQASPLACNYTVLTHWEAKLFQSMSNEHHSVCVLHDGHGATINVYQLAQTLT